MGTAHKDDVLRYDKVFIGGRWSAPSTDDVLEVRSPTTGALVGTVPRTTIADVDRAVGEARRAFDERSWSGLSFAARGRHLEALAAALRARGNDLDQLVAAESGIPVVFASGSSACSLLDFFADLGSSYRDEEYRSGLLANGIIRRAPVGVVAGITPWNGPVMQVLMKIAPALLAGNAIVVKAAEETPLSSLAVAEACAVAGLPEGLISIVSGGREVGEHLVDHPGVDHVSFTGSTAVGRRIAVRCAERFARYNLELGGKSAAVFLGDVDLDASVSTAVSFGLFYNGEACAALTRILVPRRMHDDVTDRVVAMVESLAVGDPLAPETFIGPLISESQRDRVEAIIADAVSQGAKLVTGGGRPDLRGWFVTPTVFCDVDNAWRVAQEEIFGPVLSIIPYDDVDHAIRLANDSAYGLAGAVFSADDERAKGVARRIRSGHVGINTLGMDWALPFGGFKQSGVGRELGREGLDEFTQIQTLGLLP